MKRTVSQRVLLCLTWALFVSLVMPARAWAAVRPIALDSGHGGGDEGAVYGDLVERDINWEITQACKAELERMGYSVVIVNTVWDNYDIDERVQFAVANNCPVIISLHNNAWDGKSAQRRGCTVLVPNSSSYEYGLYDLGQRFAGTVTSSLKSELGIPLWEDGSYERDFPADEWGSTYPDGSRADYYGIVRHARMRGIFGAIIEHAYLDSSADAKILRRSGTLQTLGVIDAHAIAAYYDEFVAYADQAQAERVASGRWVSQGGKWWYRYANGTYPAGRMLQIGGATYGFDGDGWMVTGWRGFDGVWYWFDKSGALARDAWTSDGYYVGPDGAWDQSVERKASGSGESAAAKAQWISSGGRWWYRHADGSYTTSGWEKIDGVWYLFDGSGWMRTGWASVGGTWYYLRGSGAMATGWVRDGGAWYYLRDSGAMATGWVKNGGSWYYLGSDGAMLSSTYTPDGYYVNASGAWVA